MKLIFTSRLITSVQKLIPALGLMLFCGIAFSQNIVVDGTNVLVSSAAKFPIWLKATQTLAAGTNVTSVSVIEYNVVSSPSGGNVLTLEQVVKVTSVQTVPNGKTWKIEAVLLDPGVTGGSNGSGWVDDGTVVRLATATDKVGIGNVSPSPHQLAVGTTTGDAQAVTIRAYSNDPGSWKGSGAFGYTTASVIMGELSGVAQIGGHNATLNAWSNLALNSGAGNVGIGNSTPGAKLDVTQATAGAMGTRILMPSGAETTAPGLRVYGYSPAIELMDKDNIQNWYIGIDDNDANKFLIGRGYGPGQGVAQAITIDAADNVGIGVTNPTGKLHVGGSHANGVMADGNDRPSVGATGTYPQMVMMAGGSGSTSHGATVMIGSYDSGTSGNHKHWSIGSAGNGSTFLDIGYHGGTDLNPHAGIRNYNGSTVMSILNTGNVGIGSLTPGQKLSIDGTAPIAEIRSGGFLMLRPADNSWDMRLQTVGTRLDVLSGGSLGTPIATFINGGNVGIGSITANQKLIVGDGGGIGFAGSGLNAADKKLYSPGDGDLEWMTHSSAGVHGFAISHQGTKAVYLNISGNSYLNGGNVGIGMTSPQAKLDVDGEEIRKLVIAQGTGADDTDNGVIPSRVLTYTKKYGVGVTGLRVTYSDNFRVYTASGGGQACRWEIKFNGVSCTNPGVLAHDVYEGASGQNHHRFSTFCTTCKSLAAGTYTIQLYVTPSPGYSSCDCYTGWQEPWELSVEEVRY